MNEENMEMVVAEDVAAEPMPTAALDMAAQILALIGQLNVVRVRCALLLAGVRAEQLARAERLVGPEADESGAFTEASILAEVEAVLKDFPELRAQGMQILRVGAKSDDAAREAAVSPIARIFGNA